MTLAEQAAGSEYPIENLPIGIGHDGDRQPRAWVAIGDNAVDLAAVARHRLLDGLGLPKECFSSGTLNNYLGLGPHVWHNTRVRIQELLSAPNQHDTLLDTAVQKLASLKMMLPMRVTDYVDFYSSIHHATNMGKLFRPDDEPLLPNWRQLPVGYHGRASTIVVDGTDIPRPSGLRSRDTVPEYGPTAALDIELELGTVVGPGNKLGEPISINVAHQHLYGVCLVNDWSARDIQAYEYRPLGPFLGKSFATSMSPWLISLEALEPFRVSPPRQEPEPDKYLVSDTDYALDLNLEVWLESAEMRAAGTAPVRISQTNFSDMYWTQAQQLAHLTANGAVTKPGDLFASGTISGPVQGSEGSLLELTWRGERPMSLPDGSERSFLADGDRIELRGYAENGDLKLGLGSVSGTIVG